MAAMLRVEHLTKVYPTGVKALSDVSVEIQHGEFVACIGSSGAGKSTFVRCINRLVEPTSGKVFLDNMDVTAASPEQLREARRQIAMIFQQFNLVKRSSVLTNVLSGRLGYVPTWRSMLGWWPAEEMQRAYANLDRVGIADKAHQRADQLSGGQQQRVAIARALMQEPKMMIADEPVSSLDPALAHSVMRYLEQINQEDGLTIICNLHFLDLVRRYATRVLAFRDGELALDCKPDEIDRERFKQIYGEEAEELR